MAGRNRPPSIGLRLHYTPRPPAVAPLYSDRPHAPHRDTQVARPSHSPPSRARYGTCSGWMGKGCNGYIPYGNPVCILWVAPRMALGRVSPRLSSGVRHLSCSITSINTNTKGPLPALPPPPGPPAPGVGPPAHACLWWLSQYKISDEF